MGKFTLIAESALPLEIEFAGRLSRGGGGVYGGSSLLLSNVAALLPVVLLCHDEEGQRWWRSRLEMDEHETNDGDCLSLQTSYAG